jgi:cytochrome c oxidase subunit 2
VTELARDIRWLDNFLLVIITLISLFVIILLGIVALKFNKKSNPEPAKFTHHSALEITWTLVPTAILVLIGVFSLPILFKQYFL